MRLRGIAAKLLRAGVKVLAGMTDAQLVAAMAAVPLIKTGRPKGKKGTKADAARNDAASNAAA